MGCDATTLLRAEPEAFHGATLNKVTASNYFHSVFESLRVILLFPHSLKPKPILVQPAGMLAL